MGRVWQRVRYRIWQVWVSLRPEVTDEDKREAARWLSPKALHLWQRQVPRDQAHTLRTLRRLHQEGYTHPSLLAAALLHDVGKAEADLRLWHRIIWVILKRCCPQGRRLLASPHGWRKPFWVLAEHPLLGAVRAREAGCDEETVWLIAHHQDDIEYLRTHAPGTSSLLPYLAALQRADDST